ncbi:hypothetical protein [Novosphingobium sp. FKTRR1]|uniref:hypothetical protein n=1 Tax=Novosphingobium sp. FKTRR1 TaxID=2879118 RepID=UPI001CEFD293|nr:hypothetical protein [Novosphingobium sp. FKTRR1]
MTSRRVKLLMCAGLVVAGLSGAVAAQESLLPPGFDDKPAAPQRAPRAPATAKTPSATAKPAARPGAQSAAKPTGPVAAAKPGGTATPVARPAQPVARGPAPLVAQVPEDAGVSAGTTGRDAPAQIAAAPVDNLDDIDPALIDQLIRSATPKVDIPPQAQRSLAQVGFLAEADGGLPATSTHYLNGAYVGPILDHLQGRLVSRWGHILLRRTLASRLDTPVGMNGADWAAARAQVLLRMGEADAARQLVQAVDNGFYTRNLEDAALAAMLATADPVGICPVTALTAAAHPGWDWDLSRAICLAFTGGEGAPAMARLDQAMRKGTGDRIDILLAQKFAGAAAHSRRAVTIEWKGVDALTAWRTGLAFATGIEPPESLRASSGAGYALLATRAPMLSLAARARAADIAAGRGVLSSAAMIDLYAQIAALEEPDAVWGPLAGKLRTAYTAPEAGDRLSAIKDLWGDASDPDRAFSRLVLTAYAAARMVPEQGLSGDAEGLIASMLTAGLDRNAARWAPYLSVGSEAWGLIMLASPGKLSAISTANLDSFVSGDDSSNQLRARFLVAGLAGLGRIDANTAREVAAKLKLDLARETRWTRAIDAAAESDNPALVALLAAFGMQGDRWDHMTGLHLYHIVSALRRVGLDGEARMIAAEAVSRV